MKKFRIYQLSIKIAGYIYMTQKKLLEK